MHRCQNCDRDGEVPDSDRGWKRCPDCDGKKWIRGDPMTEETLYRWLMISTASLAALCGLGAVALLVICALNFSLGTLLCSGFLTGGAIASGYFTMMFASKAETPKVFNNLDEREVLTMKQRRELRRARGEVVMEKAMTEVEHERDNIVHKAIEAANDPARPPHQTRWTDGAEVRQIRSHGFLEDD